MLKTRVLTALVLLSILLPSLFFLPQLHWSLLLAGFVAIGAWEWGGLLRWNDWARRLLGAFFFLGCTLVTVLSPAVIGALGDLPSMPLWVLATYAVAALFWCLVIPFWLRCKWPLDRGVLGLLVGLLLLFPTWLALVQLRTLGAGALLALFAVVWVADIAAYFSGKAFGRRKLAPSISPGKTWEGAIGAVLGVLVYGLLARFGLAADPGGLVVWIPVLVLLTVISIIGDLYESLLKRQAGIKDSSNVLPGHGGVLDRIDSLTSTMPIVALLWLLTGMPHP